MVLEVILVVVLVVLGVVLQLLLIQLLLLQLRVLLNKEETNPGASGQVQDHQEHHRDDQE